MPRNPNSKIITKINNKPTIHRLQPMKSLLIESTYNQCSDPNQQPLITNARLTPGHLSSSWRRMQGGIGLLRNHTDGKSSPRPTKNTHSSPTASRNKSFRYHPRPLRPWRATIHYRPTGWLEMPPEKSSSSMYALEDPSEPYRPRPRTEKQTAS